MRKLIAICCALVVLVVFLLSALSFSQNEHYATLVEFEESQIACIALLESQNNTIDESIRQTQACVENTDIAMGQTKTCVENFEVLINRYRELETAFDYAYKSINGCVIDTGNQDDVYGFIVTVKGYPPHVIPFADVTKGDTVWLLCKSPLSEMTDCYKINSAPTACE